MISPMNPKEYTRVKTPEIETRKVYSDARLRLKGSIKSWISSMRVPQISKKFSLRYLKGYEMRVNWSIFVEIVMKVLFLSPLARMFKGKLNRLSATMTPSSYSTSNN